MMAFIPALRLLRQAIPNAKITLLCKHAGGIEIIRNCPYYDDMIVVRNRSFKEKLRLIWEFRKRKLDYFIISPQDRGRVPWALLGGAKRIVAFKEILERGKIKKEKLAGWINVCPEYDSKLTETENCAALIEAFCKDCGIPFPHPANLELEYSWATPKSDENIDKLLKENELKIKKYFIIAPFSAKQPSRNWNNQHWHELIIWIHKQYGFDIVIIGGAEESALVPKLNLQDKKFVYNLCGKTTLEESFVLLERSAGFVGLDSGPAFLAAAASTPSVILYGPGDIKRWHPPQTTAPRVNIYHPQACSPCKYKVCPNGELCMNAISVEEIKKHIKSMPI